MTRLLLCHTCRSIDELPDYEGPAEYDVLLEDTVQRHRFPDGTEHVGKLASVATADWENNTRRAAILDEIKTAVEGATGLPSEWYATKNTYQADALKCYSEHHRPKEGCIDWRDDKKRLGNPTKWGRTAGPKIWLCDFCPVRSWVDTQRRAAAGHYKET